MTKSAAIRQSILLVGNYRPSLAIARTLANLGYHVIAGTQGCDLCFRYSRYISEFWEHADGLQAPAQFLDELTRTTDARPDIVGVFPVSEDYIRLLTSRAPWVGLSPPVISVSGDLVEACLDKVPMMIRAADLGVPTAKFAVAKNQTEFLTAIREIGLPIVLRPLISRYQIDGKKAVILRTQSHSESIAIDWNIHAGGVILQREFIGDRHNVYFASVRGRLVQHLQTVIKRTDRIDGTGLAVDGLSICGSGDLRKQTEAIARDLDYTGIGCSQFLVNSDTGASSFLELNPRVTGSHTIPENSDLRLTEFLLDHCLFGIEDQTIRVGRRGVRYTWFSADVISTLSALARGEISKARGIQRFLGAVLRMPRTNVDMVLSWADPLPGLMSFYFPVQRMLESRQKPVSGIEPVYPPAPVPSIATDTS